MIQHPGILALLLASGLVSLLLAAAGWQGFRILRGWNLQSGSDAQLDLERRTYLVSTLVANALVIQILSLFLFIFTADSLHTQFVGAMCAAGSLAANPFGYPTLLAKLATCLLAGVWLILHRADTQGRDYPLIRPKYALLLVLVPLVLAETWLQWRYLSGLKADVLTSCCGSLFGQGRQGLAAELAGLPPRIMQPVFWITFGALMAAGALLLRARRGAVAFSLLSLAFLLVSVASLISFFCLYIYELPTHHCPFCLLQREYGFVGYPIYGTLLGGAIAGLGVGVLSPFRARKSLAEALPRMQARLAWSALILAGIFTLMVGIWMILSPLKL
ncbi:MAG: hypothetical protein Q8K67_11515 [Geothrix sp.]|nr:hypothetical protein [Geothrix sp.]